MKFPSFLLVAFFLFLLPPSRAADSSDAKPDVKQELKALVEKIRTKLKDSQRTEPDLAPEIEEFDALLAKHAGEKTDELAQVLYMKAQLYFEVLHDDAKGSATLDEIKAKFPDTRIGRDVDRIQARRALHAALKVGSPFPNFEEQDLEGAPISVAALKGKIVLIDFWATWCGPCVQELPNVIETYRKYHDKGFDIIGVSLDQDKSALTSFIAKKGMEWPQYFDGQGWKNKLAQKYGIDSIPSTYLLDKEGNILAEGLRGKALEEAVAKALGSS